MVTYRPLSVLGTLLAVMRHNILFPFLQPIVWSTDVIDGALMVTSDHEDKSHTPLKMEQRGGDRRLTGSSLCGTALMVLCIVCLDIFHIY